MNIHKFKGTNTDLGRFYEFIDNLDANLLIKEEDDWDYMCGIVVSQFNSKGTCFNFHDDGSFRAVFKSDEDFDMKTALAYTEKKISYKSFWGMFKYWRKIKSDAKGLSDEY